MTAESLHKAVIAQYTAKKYEAVAMLELIYNKSIAIADHTSLLDEVNKWVAQLDKAESSIRALQGIFSKTEEGE
jgi:hypothetical protein